MDSSDMCWPSAHMQADDTKHLATKVRNPSPIYQLAWMIQKSLEGHSESKQKPSYLDQVWIVFWGKEHSFQVFLPSTISPTYPTPIPWIRSCVSSRSLRDKGLVVAPTGTAARWSETTPWGLPTEWQAMPEITQGGTVNFLSLKNATRIPEERAPITSVYNIKSIEIIINILNEIELYNEVYKCINRM